MTTDHGLISRWEARVPSVDATTATAVQSASSSATRFYAVGETTVERPAWVDRARSAAEPRTTETGTVRSWSSRT